MGSSLNLAFHGAHQDIRRACTIPSVWQRRLFVVAWTTNFPKECSENVMISDPYTIRIDVKDGDPEGVRLIDQMNWTGKGIVFPREKWNETQEPASLRSAGRLHPVGIFG